MMKNKKGNNQNRNLIVGVFICIVIVVFVMLALKEPSDNSVKNITVNELEQLLDEDYQFVDIRTSNEYYGESGPSHIEEFDINIDYYQFKNDLSLFDDLDKTKPIVIICNSGNRSGDAAPMLVDYGFEIVYNVKGGMQAWIRK